MDLSNTTSALGIIVPCTISALLYSVGLWLGSKNAKQKKINALEQEFSDVLQHIKRIDRPNISSFYAFKAFKLSTQLNISIGIIIIMT